MFSILTAQIIVLEAFIAFLTTYLVTPLLIRAFTKNGITGIDVHKIEKPVRAKMCGLGAVIGFCVAVLSTNFFLPLSETVLAATLTVMLSSVVGIYDDLRNIKQRRKVLLLLFAAAPLAWVLRSQSTLALPLIGNVNFGWVMPFILVPVGVSAAANLTNMLAGFNGLEAGLGSLALGSVATCALILGLVESYIIALPMAIALCSFLLYNWYPAKAFPGDTGTLAIGTALACAVIIGRIEVIGILVLAPHIVDFFTKLLGAIGKCKPFGQRKIYGDTVISQDGFLHPPPYVSFPHFIMNIQPTTEKKLVKMLVLFEVLIGIIAIITSVTVI